MKRILKLAALGFLLGIFVCSIMTLIGSSPLPASQELVDKIGSLKAAMALQLALSGLYGVLCMGSVVLYDEDRLPLSLASVIHCVICIGPFIPLALVLNWCSTIGEALIMTAFQFAAYLIVWLIMFIIYRKQTKELNEINDNQKLTESEEK